MNATPTTLLRSLTHGVYVVGVAAGTETNAFTAAWIMQASFDPPLLVLSINPRHQSYRLLQRGGQFTVSVLAREQCASAARFGQAYDSGKLDAGGWHRAACGAPILDDAIAWMQAALVALHPAGDHVLAVGRVETGAVLRPHTLALVYADTGNLDGTMGPMPPDPQ